MQNPDHLLEQKLKGAVEGSCENRSVHGSASKTLKGVPREMVGGLIVLNILSTIVRMMIMMIIVGLIFLGQVETANQR